MRYQPRLSLRVTPRELRALRVLPLLLASVAAAQSPFATQVLAYDPAPGQFVQNPQFNDPTRALGPPIGGGTIAPDNTKVVTLGGFGGCLVLAFDHRVLDDPRNFMGLDAIVFGNAVYVAGHPNRRFAEAATIEIAIDANNNGLPDDAWYVIRVPQMPAVPADWWAIRIWDDNTSDPANPPANPAWIPPGRTGTWQTSGYLLPAAPFAGPILQNPLGLTATTEAIHAITDHTPTLLLGDTNADNVIDDASIAPADFYTVPDDPVTVGITPRSGGGDAFDIAWAVDPATGQPANLPGFDFIRLTTAVDSVDPIFGEVSAEIGGVADAAPHRLRPHVTVPFAR